MEQKPLIAQMALHLALGPGCQRWHARRARYRPAGELFDPTRASVDLLDEVPAKAFVEAHHYSGTYPAARLRVGLLIKEPFARTRVGGVAVFSVPMAQAVVPKWLGVAPAAGVELGRFVLLDHPLLAANAETWFLARAFRLLRERLPDVQGVVAFCDPVERRSAAGALVKPGHTGTIYRAHNGRFAGRTSARTLLTAPTGLVLSPRAVSKLRNAEPGAEYVERQLRQAGAPRRSPGETPRDYLIRLQRGGVLRGSRHPGNFAFVFTLRRATRAVGGSG